MAQNQLRTGIRAKRHLEVTAVAALMFGAVTAWRFFDHDPQNAITVLFAVPIALTAAAFGPWGGMIAVFCATGSTVIWAETQASQPFGLTGYFAREMTFVAVAFAVGWQFERRSRLERDADRWFSLSNDLLCVADFEGRFTRVNSSWSEHLGYRDADLLGRPFIELVHPDDVERTLRETAALQDRGHRTAVFENRYRAADGSWRWLAWSARSDGRMMYAAARDVTVRKELEQTLQELARTDKLTGAANRQAWEERCNNELSRAARSGEPLSIAILGFDKLKQLNDQNGDAAGDELLIKSVAVWQDVVRDVDFVARLGGDEFGVLLPNCEPAAAAVVLERMRQTMPPEQGFSAGVARWKQGESLVDVTRRADEALCAAKKNNPGSTRVAGTPLILSVAPSAS